jgi:uncharacterized protein (TIGR00725 family)
MEPSAQADGAAYIAVVGPSASDATKADLDIALEVGRLLADQGAIVVCGGLDGVMEAACRGASERGGLTVGILPGRDRAGANAYLTVALPPSDLAPTRTRCEHARRDAQVPGRGVGPGPEAENG